MKKILMIAYYFPPMGGAGVLRMVKIVKNLPQQDWMPVVLSVKEGYRECMDPSLLKEIPSSIEIHRTRSLEPRRFGLIQKSIKARRKQKRSWLVQIGIQTLNAIRNWIFVPDEQVGWFPFAVKNGFVLAINPEIKVIFSSSTPYTAHLIGFLLNKLSGKPWVVDLRDPWTQNPIDNVPRRSYYLEKLIFKHADKIIANTPNLKKVILSDYPKLNEEKVVCITNGYDGQDFIDLVPRSKPKDQFIITYLGTFYNNLFNRGKFSRTPECFLNGLKIFIEKHTLSPKDIEVRFFGLWGKSEEALILKLGLISFVKLHGFVSHREALQWQMDSDVLLMIMHDDGKNKATVPGKTYEYLASRKPILALVGDDSVADLIRETRSGLVVNPQDPFAIEKGIDILYTKFIQGELVSGSRKDIIEKYEWRNLTRQLADIFNQL
jgi:glycosyltransferase involved in cell wall biosynthesis